MAVFKNFLKNRPNTEIDMVEKGHGYERARHTIYKKGDYEVELIQFAIRPSILMVAKGNHQSIIEHEYDMDFNPNGTNVYELFKKYTGYSVEEIEKFVENRNNPEKCRKCGSKKSQWTRGLPGEHVRVCLNCNNVLGYEFNISEII